MNIHEVSPATKQKGNSLRAIAGYDSVSTENCYLNPQSPLLILTAYIEI